MLFIFENICIITFMNNVENHKKNKEIATLGITLALVVVLQALAEIIQKFGLPISFALGLIPVFVCGQVYGVKFGAISGGVFGLVSLFIALIYSGSIPMYAVAINPLVSVLPRILCGTVCALVYKGLSKSAAKSTKPRTEKQKTRRELCNRLFFNDLRRYHQHDIVPFNVSGIRARQKL